MKNEYSIEGVKCGGCAAAVKEKLLKLDNVDNVEVNIQDKNIVVDPQNPKKIAKLAHKIISDNNFRQKIIIAGRENVKRFSWDKCAREVAMVILNETKQ